jgi:Na+/phosphate symporter
MLDLRNLFLLMILIGLICFGSYTKGWHDADKRAAQNIADLQIAALDRVRKVEKANDVAVKNVISRYEQQIQTINEKVKNLRYSLSNGDLRLSIPTTNCDNMSSSTAIATKIVEKARCDIDGTAAATLIDIARQGDAAIEKANALIEFYEGIKK